MKKILNLSKGFTIVELLIYMGLLSIFLLVLTDIFTSILEVRTESEAVSSVEQDGRFLLARFSYDINRASSITTPLAVGDISNNLVMVIAGVSYSYNLNSGNLQITNNLGTDNLNSSESNITNLSFQKLGNTGGKETIKMQFTVNSNTQRNKGYENRTFQTTIGRR